MQLVKKNGANGISLVNYVKLKRGGTILAYVAVIAVSMTVLERN